MRPSRLREHLVGVASCIIVLAACGESAGPEPEPPRVARITISPGSATLTFLGETVRFEAMVVDQYGAAFDGAVSWTSEAPTVLSIGADGNATALSNGTGTVRAELNGVSATATATVSQVATSLEIVSGDGQVGLVGTRLRDLLVVRAADMGSSAVAGVAVAFVTAPGAGSVSPAVAATNDDGEVTTSWTLGASAGDQSLTASVTGGPRTVFTARAGTNPADLADSVKVVSGDHQTGRPGKGLRRPVVVRVLDSGGYQLPDVPVVFTAADGHGLAHPDSVTTDHHGEAAAVWTLGDQLGPQLLTATVPNGPKARMTATAKPGVCDRTEQVADALVAAAGVATCDEVTAALLARVQVLALRNLGITKLNPWDLEGLVALETLQLGPNAITTLPPDIFAGLFSLRLLELGPNELSVLPIKLFAGLASLRNLSLGDNKIKELPLGIFDGLDGLEGLGLGGNNIDELPLGIFRGLSNLKRLGLMENQLTNLHPDLFAELTNLKSLGLSGNQLLNNLPAGFFANLPTLEWLEMGGIGLPRLLPGLFDGLPNLKGLSFEFSEIQEIPAGYFANLPKLESLDLSYNYLTHLDRGTFRGLSSLERLEIGGNRMDDHSLPEGVFAELTSLKRLELGNNGFTKLPAPIADVAATLEKLRLGSADIDQLSTDWFRDFSRLHSLRLQGNEIEELPVGAFCGLVALESLALGWNPGAPFTLELHLERADTTDVSAPGPASLVVTLAEGAPFDMSVNVAATGATLSSSTMLLRRGTTRSDPITVMRNTGTQGSIKVTLGSPPELPMNYDGLVVSVGGGITLFR